MRVQVRRIPAATMRMLLLGVMTLAVAAAFAQSPATPAPTVDVTRLGPQVGERAPDFALVDQHGQLRTLQSLMAAKGLVLVFNRSADW